MKKTLLVLISVILAFFLVGKSFAASPVPEGYEVWRKMVTMFYSSTTLGSLPMSTSHYLVIDENGKIGFISSSDTAKVTVYQPADFTVTATSTGFKVTVYTSSDIAKVTTYQSASLIVTISSTNHSILTYPGVDFGVIIDSTSDKILVYFSTNTAEVRSYQGADWSVSVIGLKDLVSQSTPTVYQGGSSWTTDDPNLTNKVSASTPTVYLTGTPAISVPNMTGQMSASTPTVYQGGGNWGVNTPQVQGQFSASTPTVYPGATFPVNVQSGSTITVISTDFDIRNLTFATDKTDATGSTVTVNGAVTATISGNVDTTGSTITVNGSVTAVISGTVNTTGSTHTVIATDLDIRNLSSASDSVDTTGSTITVNGTVSATISGTVNTTGSTVTVNGSVSATISGNVNTVSGSEIGWSPVPMVTISSSASTLIFSSTTAGLPWASIGSIEGNVAGSYDVYLSTYSISTITTTSSVFRATGGVPFSIKHGNDTYAIMVPAASSAECSIRLETK